MQDAPGMSAAASSPFITLSHGRVELVPVLGDNYTSILRNMKANRIKHQKKVKKTSCYVYALLINKFNVKGADLAEVKWTFTQDDFLVLTLSEPKEFKNHEFP
jgi:hypothetical protein